MVAEPNDSIENLITKSLAGEATHEEEQRLSTWLAENKSNKKLHAEFKRAFEKASTFYTQPDNTSSVNVDAEWEKFVQTVSSHDKKDNVRSLVVDRKVTPWLRIAAALLLIAVSGIVVNYYARRNSETIFQSSNTTLPVTLPDGSKVVLNAHSTLSYSTSFGEQRREVALQGEAFFDVGHDASKPFVISALATEIEVLGTSFNVMAYDSVNEVSVTVQTGKVKFSIPETKEEIMLAVGERGSYHKTEKQLQNSANLDVNFLSWKTHHLVFTENDLQSVIESINKAYNSNIQIATSVADTCVITVTFEGQSLEAILNVLKSTLNLTYREQNGQIEIVGAGC